MSSQSCTSTSEPAGVLMRAWKVQEAASAQGFDWPNAQGVLEKIREETEEIQAALDANDQAHAQRELGDLLLAAVNLSRFLQEHPEVSLNGAVDRFESRFNGVLRRVESAGRRCSDYSLHELDALWEEAKREASHTVAKALDTGTQGHADSVAREGENSRIS